MNAITSIIPISTGSMDGETVQTVNARDLHAFLGVGKDFSTWIKDRVGKYEFTYGQDFITETRSPILGSGNRGASTEYHISIDMAKELAMVENSDKGKQARRYFIECERIAKAGPALPDLSDPVVLTHLLMEHATKRIEAERRADTAERKVEEVSETVAAFDRISGADGSMCITDAAKSLQIRPRDLFTWMATNKWIYTRPGKGGYLAYQDRIQSGHLEHKVTTITRNDGTEKVTEAVKVTAKGISKLAMIVPGSAVN